MALEVTMQDLLTPAQAAGRLGFFRTSVNHIITAGGLPVVKIAGRTFIPREAVERYAATPRPIGRPRKS